jgi:formamidopyrimidine-DNA glycosylase
VIHFADGTRVALVDPRALSTLSVHPPDGRPVLPTLGPDATDPALTPAALAASLARRRLAIKPALLDQRVIAGVGNIYAAEALWRARLDPRAPARSLTRAQLRRLLDGVRRAMTDANRDSGRYVRGESAERLDVYGRAGEPCRRCGARIVRIVQGGRSTYFCEQCQRD